MRISLKKGQNAQKKQEEYRGVLTGGEEINIKVISPIILFYFCVVCAFLRPILLTLLFRGHYRLLEAVFPENLSMISPQSDGSPIV